MITMRMKHLIVALTALVWPFAAQAQSAYPSQSIRFIVPYAAIKTESGSRIHAVTCIFELFSCIIAIDWFATNNTL